jgi:hypothetical protein
MECTTVVNFGDDHVKWTTAASDSGGAGMECNTVGNCRDDHVKWTTAASDSGGAGMECNTVGNFGDVKSTSQVQRQINIEEQVGTIEIHC